MADGDARALAVPRAVPNSYAPTHGGQPIQRRRVTALGAVSLQMLTCPACGRANPGDAGFCMGCATSLVGPSIASERRTTATALFCDLVGSTSLGEQHDPEVLQPLFHAYFDEMRAAVAQHGGRVEKLIGDAVTAIFGVAGLQDDHALRAVRAGVGMIERLAVLNARSSVPLACRIGITTSDILVPAHGEPLAGDALSTASRLQAGAEAGSVIIGEATWRLVRDAVVAEPVQAIVIGDDAAPLLAYRVVALGQVR